MAYNVKKYRQKDFIVLNAVIREANTKKHGKKVVIKIPKAQWIMLVNKAIFSKDTKYNPTGQGGYG